MGDFVVRCQYCDKTGSNLRRCSRCKSVYYCTKVCQALDWPRHKEACVTSPPRVNPSKETECKMKAKRRQGQESNPEEVEINKKIFEDENHNSENKGAGTFQETLESENTNNENANVDKKYVHQRQTTSTNLSCYSGICETKADQSVEGKGSKVDNNGFGDDSKTDPNTASGANENESTGDSKLNDLKNVINAGSERNLCGFCTSSGCLKKCSRCKETFYCSSDCQRKDWPGHQSKCKKTDPNIASGAKESDSTGDSKLNNIENVNPSGSERNLCGFCASSGCLKKCSRCKETFYCSGDCQRKDWPSHQNKCKKMDPNIAFGAKESDSIGDSILNDIENVNGSERNLCGFCASSGCLKKCSRCKETFYCSGNCQKKDWPSHQNKCKKTDHNTASSTKETDSTGDSKLNDIKNVNPSGSERNLCGFCTSSGCLKKCSRCKETFYCSGDCQRKNWPSHQSNCKKKLTEEDERILRGWKKKQDHVEKCKTYEESTHPIFSTFNNYTPPSDRFFKTLTQEQALRRATPPKGSLSNAARMARMHFPLYDIVTDFEHVPSEPMFPFFPFMIPPRSRFVLVAFIYRYHEHAMRHGVYLKDARDEESKVEFYLDHVDDNPSPFFPYSQVKPGGYICLKDPVMHLFVDGTVGIRINNPEQVLVLDIKHVMKQ